MSNIVNANLQAVCERCVYFAEQSIWVCTCVAKGTFKHYFDKVFPLSFWNRLHIDSIDLHNNGISLWWNWVQIEVTCTLQSKDQNMPANWLGMPISSFRYPNMDFLKRHIFKYDFWEKPQYSNMKFWCFLVTPGPIRFCLLDCTRFQSNQPETTWNHMIPHGSVSVHCSIQYDTDDDWQCDDLGLILNQFLNTWALGF